jgi:hypothetical protein
LLAKPVEFILGSPAKVMPMRLDRKPAAGARQEAGKENRNEIRALLSRLGQAQHDRA